MDVNVEVTLFFAIQGCAGLRILIVFCNSGLRWRAYFYFVLQFRVAQVCVSLLCFAIQGCAGVHILILFCNLGLQRSAEPYCVLRFRVVVCVFFLCFAIQGCAGVCIFVVFCTSGCFYCVLQFRVALVCVFLLCFTTQGCYGLPSLILFRVALVYVIFCVLQYKTQMKNQNTTHKHTNIKHANTKTLKHKNAHKHKNSFT